MIYGLHGAVGSADDWEPLASSLARNLGATMTPIDLWRFLEGERVSLSEFGALLNAEVRAQVGQGEAADLIGYSMGGRLALHALIDEPGLWRSAVIVSAHTGLEEAQRPARLAHDAVWAELAECGDWADFLKQWNAQGVLANDVMPDRKRLEKSRNAVARSLRDWSLGSQQDLRDQLHTISCPVLWVVGEKDAKFRAIAEQAIGMLPNARLEVVTSAGHRVPWEQPEKFHSLVCEWLSQFCEPSRAL